MLGSRCPLPVSPSPKFHAREVIVAPSTVEALESNVQSRLVQSELKAATGVAGGPSPSGSWNRNSARGEPQLMPSTAGPDTTVFVPATGFPD